MNDAGKQRLALVILVTACALLAVAAIVWSFHLLVSEAISGMFNHMDEAIRRLGP